MEQKIAATRIVLIADQSSAVRKWYRVKLNLSSIILIGVLLTLSGIWFRYSSTYIGLLRYSASSNCKTIGCGGFLELNWIRYIQPYEKIALFTYGLPGLLADRFFNILIEFVGDLLMRSSFGWVVFILMDTVLYILLLPFWGIAAVGVPFSLIKAVAGKWLHFNTSLAVLLGLMGTYILIGIPAYQINPLPYKSPFTDTSAEVRDVQRRSDLEVLIIALLHYMQDTEQIPPQLSLEFQDVASGKLDLCPLIIPKQLGCMPFDPLIPKETSCMNSCNRMYDTGYQISFDAQNRLFRGRAPKAETKNELVVEKSF